MTQAVQIEECGHSVEAIRKGETWVQIAEGARDRYTQVIATLGRECREWPEGATHAEIQALIEENCVEDEIIFYTDGSVQRGIKSGWGYTAAYQGMTVQEASGATGLTTSSMCMEIKAITEGLKWLGDSQHSKATFLTDSKSTLDKIETGSLYADWVKTIQDTQSISRLQWIFCPGHAGVKGNERADQLAGSAKIEGVLTLDSPTVIELVRDHLASTRVEDSFTKEMLIEKGVKPGEARKCELRDPVRRYNNQLMMETVSLHTLRWTLKRRGEEAWSTPSS